MKTLQTSNFVVSKTFGEIFFHIYDAYTHFAVCSAQQNIKMQNAGTQAYSHSRVQQVPVVILFA